MAARGKANNKYGGMKWITHHRRLAIYLRDGLACVYCGLGIEDGVRLTLDHLVPHSTTTKPNNKTENLVTACATCNSSRGNRDVDDFCLSVAAYRSIPVKKLTAHIRACVVRTLDVAAAKDLLARRGSLGAAMQKN